MRFVQCYNAGEVRRVEVNRERRGKYMALVDALGFVKATLFLGRLVASSSSKKVLRLVISADAEREAVRWHRC